MSKKPGHDYSLVEYETLVSFQSALIEYEDSKLIFMDCDPDDEVRFRVLAQDHLLAYDALVEVVSEVKMDSLVLPALVHVAGDPEEREDGAWRQNCVNCGSWLAAWSPGAIHTTDDGASYELDLDDYSWWPPDVKVAKSDQGLWVVGFECMECGGSGRRNAGDCGTCHGAGFVERDLRPGEVECVGKEQLEWQKDE